MIKITIVYAILIFIVLILVHEIGHFIAAKSCGVRVVEFAIGLGPKLFKKQIGETEYVIRALPFGGQCVMDGEDEESSNPRSFNNAAKCKRLIILLAGVFMNLLMGFCIFLFLYASATTPVPVIDYFMPKYTGGEDALMPGDRIISVDGYNINTTSDISTAFEKSNDYYFDFVVERNGETLEFKSVYIEPQEYIEDGESVYRYGFHYKSVKLSTPEKFKLAFNESINMVKLVFDGLKSIISGGVKLNDLAGPVGITATMSTVAKQDMSSFWYLAGLIAVNLAVMNLLPIPALDGGRILFLGIEAISRRKINRKVEGIVNATVLVLLFGLMIIVTANDIWRLIK